MGWFGRWLGGNWFGNWFGASATSTVPTGPFLASMSEVGARTATLEDLDVSPYTATLAEIAVYTATLE